MKSSLNPITAAIYQTTGLFIDKLKEDDKVMNELSRHFFRNHKEDYKAAVHNIAVKSK